jgi:iron complex transport system permease protein
MSALDTSGLSQTMPAEAMGYWRLVAGLALAAIAMTILSVFVGYARLDVLQALADFVHGNRSLPALVLIQLRLPRALLGCFVGFSLGMSGAAMQGLLRNPLAEPGVIGISGAAAFGAVVVFYSGPSGALSLALPLGGIAGAIFAALVLYGLVGRGAGTMTLILAGVAINSFAGAVTSLALNLSPNPYAAVEIIFWLMGSLVDRSLPQVWLVLPRRLPKRGARRPASRFQSGEFCGPRRKTLSIEQKRSRPATSPTARGMTKAVAAVPRFALAGAPELRRSEFY